LLSYIEIYPELPELFHVTKNTQTVRQTNW